MRPLAKVALALALTAFFSISLASAGHKAPSGELDLSKGVKALLTEEMALISKGMDEILGSVVAGELGKVAGFETVKKFQQEMAKKLMLSANFNPGMMAQLGEGMMKGMGEASKKMAEMEGMPLETVMRMGGGGGAPPAASEAPAPAASENQPKASEAIGGAIGSSLGRLGGFGRLGRGKAKKEEEPPPPAAQEQARQRRAQAFF